MRSGQRGTLPRQVQPSMSVEYESHCHGPHSPTRHSAHQTSIPVGVRYAVTSKYGSVSVGGAIVASTSVDLISGGRNSYCDRLCPLVPPPCSQTIPLFLLSEHVLSTGEKLRLHGDACVVMHSEECRVRTAAYNHVHSTHKADEALNSTPRSPPYHIHIKTTRATRIVSPPPPTSAIDELYHRSPLVPANTKYPATGHRVNRLYMFCLTDSREGLSQQHHTLTKKTSGK